VALAVSPYAEWKGVLLPQKILSASLASGRTSGALSPVADSFESEA
jgi:hypothetical protein